MIGKSFANGNGNSHANGPVVPLHLRRWPELAEALQFSQHQLTGI